MKTALSLFMFFGLALAQIQPQAAQLLERSRQAHGGAALQSLKTYQETATIKTYVNGQLETTTKVVSYTDFLSQRLRLEYFDQEVLIQIVQVSPTQGIRWSQTGGREEIRGGELTELRNALNQTWYGLRFGGSGRQVARALDKQTFQGIQGQAVDVQTKGAKTTYLFNTQNQLVAERYKSGADTLTIVYSDIRAVSRLRIPFAAKLYSNGELFAETQVSEAKVNPTFTAQTFRPPNN
jgi:prolyl oligopeptidase PreP (S9A serine peptidase family)